MQRRGMILATAVAACVPGRLLAQSDWRRVAVPVYDAGDLVNGFLREHALPSARAWQASCGQLTQALSQQAPAAVVRAAWQRVAVDWAALSAVSTGPLLTRRSARRVDFHPVRPALVERAIAQAPAGEADMEHIGTAAKGLAALEWLLWAREAPSDAPAHAYAVALAQDLQREADAIATEFDTLAAARMDDEQTVAWFAELFNQWVGGLEQLRLQGLVRPVEEAATRGARAPLSIRPHARSDAAERAARWQSLASLAAFQGAAAPAKDSGALLPYETFLRGRGLNPLADRLRASVRAVEPTLRAAGADQPAAMRRAAATVAALKRLAEAELATALDVRVGFSDADGD